jgi:hypothetical protein
VGANVIDSVARAFEVFFDGFLRAESGVVGAKRNARFGGGICQGITLCDSIGIRNGIPISGFWRSLIRPDYQDLVSTFSLAEIVLASTPPFSDDLQTNRAGAVSAWSLTE